MGKVLFILHLPPPIHGAAQIGESLKNSKYLNDSLECSYINLSTSRTIDGIGKRNFVKLIRYTIILSQLFWRLISSKPKLCYVTPTSAGVGFIKDIPVIAIIKLFGVKTIFHYHNKGIESHSNSFLDNLLYKFVFKKTNVILLSKYLYHDIEKYIPEARVFYCANGITDLPCEQRGQLAGNEDNMIEILYLSHLIRSKGVLVLIEACSLLKEKNIKFHCTIAGGNSDLTIQDVEDIVRSRQLSEYMFVSGPLYGEEKLQLMQMADIFVHPSFNDCFPLVLLEAMRSSLPVISTFEGAIPDIVHNGITGFLVSRQDSLELANRLEILIKDPGLRKEMGAAGRKRYENEFTLEIFERRMKKILEQQLLP